MTTSSAAARPAVLLAVAWTAALVVLAAVWIQSPFTGPGPMFLAWSGAALPLALWSWTRVRRWGVEQAPRTVGPIVGLIVIWGLVAVAAFSDLPGIWALDGLILRSPGLRAAGIGLRWLPGVFGLALSVAGLALALEARYRLARGQTRIDG